MDLVLKKPYELSIWEDRQYYVYTLDNSRYVGRTVPSGATIKNDFLKEEKIAIFGGDQLDSPIKALNVKLSEKISGEHELTFQLSAKYLEDGEPRWNPYYNLLCNEQKVKLKYDGRWFDFSIKRIEETSENQLYTYTCAEIVTETLGRTGYDVELNEDYENNMGSVTYLAEKVMNSSEWRVAATDGTPQIADPNNDIYSDVIKQYANEALFTYTTTASVSVEALDNFSFEGETIAKGYTTTIPTNSTVYLFYSDLLNGAVEKQVFWRANGQYITDEDGNIINSAHWITDDLSSLDIDSNNISVSTTYRGDKIVIKQVTEYIPQIDKYCPVYIKNNQEYYCYETTEFASGTNIQQILTNNIDMSSDRGWFLHDGGTSTFSVNSDGSITAEMKRDDVHGNLINSLSNKGPYDNRAVFSNGIAPGDSFVLEIEYAPNSSKFNYAVLCAKGENIDYTYTFSSYTDVGDITTFTYRVPDTSQYNGALSYSKILELNNFYFSFLVTSNKTVTFKSVKLYKKVTDANGVVIKPNIYEYVDGQGTARIYNSIIKPTYRMFAKSSLGNVSSLEDITFFKVFGAGAELETISSNFIPKMSEDYEKIRSLEVKQSNRFNIIQKLCETFECWVKFVTNYDEDGRIIYGYQITDDTKVIKGKRYYQQIASPSSDYDVDYNYNIISNSELELIDNPHSENYYEKIYDKFVQFKQYIEKDNYAGFRRGINLKSVSRKIASDNITTKLIVEQNNNEMAEPFGSCDIQTSSLNTYGETALYNFDYYINQRILEKDDIYYDLYGGSIAGGLKFLTTLSNLNKENQSLITQLSGVQNTLTRAEAQLQVSSSTAAEASKEKDDNIQYLQEAGISPGPQGWEDKIDNIINNRASYPDVIYTYAVKANSANLRYTQYSSLETQNQAAVNGYTAQVETLQTTLANIRKQKDALIREFNSKYGRYIREGSWIDEDYFDADLYYLDGLGVLYNSAFPKVEYTINVIDISQLEEYKGYTFNVGDKSYVEDVEFFGYQDDKITPYKQEVIVSQVVWSLDDPSQNTITVKNYKDSFDSLFQRVTAATQALQYSEGGYARAAAAVKPEGILDTVLMQNTLSANRAVITNVKDQTVTWDKTGITISSMFEPEKIVRLVNGGIVLTEDGGKNWTTGITASGINASTITTGVLDADMVRIFNGGQPNFVWDKDGLNAYYQAVDQQGHQTGPINNTQYVRFNGSGLVGKNGNATVFALTYDGFELNATDETTSNYVKINANGVVVGNKKKIIYAGTNNKDKFIIYDDGSGEFAGTIRAQDLQLPDPNSQTGYTSILENNKIKNNYLDLGNITIDGNNTSITLGTNGVITIGDNSNYIRVSSNGITFGGASGFLTETDLETNYGIEHTTVGQSYISSPVIYAGTFYASNNSPYKAAMEAGSFRLYNGNSAFFNLTHVSNNLATLQSPYSMSLSAMDEISLQSAYVSLNGKIYVGSKNYGSAPSGTEENGRLYFQIIGV